MSTPSQEPSTTLPESQQDANIAATYDARPGTTDAMPAGVSTTSSQTLSGSVKTQLDGLVDQVPSTQFITDQLPSAQATTDAVKSGASALVAGISNLALGVSNAAADNASASHPESNKAQDVDDLHIPGAFDDSTSDRDDIAAVQRGAQSVYQSLPSKESVTGAVPSVEQIKQQVPSLESDRPTGSLTEQAQSGARSLQAQAQQGVEYVKEQLPGQQTAVGQQSEVKDSQTHQEGTDYIKEQVFGQGDVTNSSAGQQSEVKDSQTHKEGIDYLKDRLSNQGGIMNSSVGAESSTNQLAGQVPLEPRGVPQVVADSQRQAGEAAPLDVPGFHLADNTSSTNQLAGQVPLETRGVPEVVAESQREAGAAPEASANPEAVREKSEMERELQREVPEQSSTGGTGVGQTLAGAATSLSSAVTGAVGQKSPGNTGVPEVVTESQREAGAPAEASANPEAVREKSEMERELQREVSEQSSTSGAGIGQTIAGAATALSSAVTGVVGQNTSRSTGVPDVVAESQREAGAPAEASANPEAVREKSEMERELQREVPEQSSTGGTGIGQTVAGGAAALGLAAASAVGYAREKTQDVTGTDPVAVLPDSVQRTIDQDNSSSNAPTSGDHPGQTLSERTGPAGDSSYPRVVGISQPTGDSGKGVDLHSGIKNGVVGVGSDHPFDASHSHAETSLGTSPAVGGSREATEVGHVSSVTGIDLSAGVKNSVVGAGSKDSI